MTNISRAYRLPQGPTADGNKSPWLSPDRPTEKTPLIRVPSAPPPSTANSSFFDQLQSQIRQDAANNNGPLNNNTINQQQHCQMAELARGVAQVVEQKLKTDTGDEEESNLGMTGNVFQSAVRMTSTNCVKRMQKQASASSTIAMSREASANAFQMVLEGASLEEIQEAIANEQMMREASAMELDLIVDTWSVDDAGRPEASGSQKEVLDGVSRLRGFGSFLADQLADEAAKTDREWGRARKQRNSLLDALIRALVEGEETNMGRKKRNGLLSPEAAEVRAGWAALERKKSRSFDLGCQQQHLGNGWPAMATESR